MEFRHLRYFLAVAEERNITRAAEKLHIAQPPLSRQIQQLEDLLGVALFVRGSRPLELTEAGQHFRKHAAQLLNSSKNLIATTRHIGKVEAKFTMGFVGSTLYGLLPEVARRFKTAHPHVDFSLLEMTTMEQVRALNEGEIDVGIGRIRHEDPNVRRILLREEPLVVAVPVEHRLASAEAVSLSDLVSETVILFPQNPRPSFMDLVMQAFHDRGLEPNRTVEAREVQVSLGLVAAGMGITIAPKSVTGMQRRDIVFKPFSDVRLVVPIFMNIRMNDESEYLRSLQQQLYELYRAENIPHFEEAL
jgi:DNA-binding transcriptional LysR family regulator